MGTGHDRVNNKYEKAFITDLQGRLITNDSYTVFYEYNIKFSISAE